MNKEFFLFVNFSAFFWLVDGGFVFVVVYLQKDGDVNFYL